MTYLGFHLIFIVPALALTWFAARGARRTLGGRAAWSVPLLALLALVWTTPWDNYLVASGVWTYGEDRVIGTIGWVPVEEYLFFVLQPLLTGWLLCALMMRRAPSPAEPRAGPRLVGVSLWLGAAAAGALALRTGPGTYFGLILVWAAPVAAAQWAFAERAIRRRAPEFVTAVVASTIYLCIADAIAIRSGVWTIQPATSTGHTILGLPVEEATFFLVTNLLVAQGLLLFLDPPHLSKAT